MPSAFTTRLRTITRLTSRGLTTARGGSNTEVAERGMLPLGVEARIFPRNVAYADSYPEQHHDNGVAKNTADGGRHKDIVRCMERIAIRRDKGWVLCAIVESGSNQCEAPRAGAAVPISLRHGSARELHARDAAV